MAIYYSEMPEAEVTKHVGALCWGGAFLRLGTVPRDDLLYSKTAPGVSKTPGWFKVIIVEPTGMKPVKLIGRAARPSHRPRMSAGFIATTVTKPGRLRPMTEGAD
jgi:hypothetical protein